MPSDGGGEGGDRMGSSGRAAPAVVLSVGPTGRTKGVRATKCFRASNGPLRLRARFLKSPRGTLGYATCVQVAGSTKLRKKMGSSVAYKTIGTFLSKVRRKHACGQSTKQAKAGAVQRYEATTAKRWYLDPTISYTLSSLITPPSPHHPQARKSPPAPPLRANFWSPWDEVSG